MMVWSLLSAWMLVGCQQVDRPARPDAATFAATPVDTAVEPLPVEEEAPALRGGNNAPIVRQARIDPKKPTRSQPLTVLVETFDKDGDLLRTRYRWFVNDNPLSGASGERLTPGAYEKGDRVSVEVTVTDGPNDTVFMSKAVEIANSPPEMVQGRAGGQLDGMKIEVTDPDDDTLRFSLSGAPPGLSIDQTGVLHFNDANDLTEPTTYTTRITAEDPDGEQAIWELTLTLNPSTPPTRRYTPGG